MKNVNAFIIKAKRTSTQNKCSQSYLPGFATASSMKRWLKHGSPIEALGDDKKRRGQGVRKAKGSRSRGFKDSSGSLGIFFQNLEAKDSLHSAVSLASPSPFIPNS